MQAGIGTQHSKRPCTTGDDAGSVLYRKAVQGTCPDVLWGLSGGAGAQAQRRCCISGGTPEQDKHMLTGCPLKSAN